MSKSLGDAANFELESFLADRIALLRQSLHSTIFRRWSFVSFGEWIVSIFNYLMPLACEAVIVFRDLDSDKAPAHLMSDESRCSGTIEAVQHEFLGLSEKREQPPHNHRRQLARMIYAATVVFQSMDVVPQIAELSFV